MRGHTALVRFFVVASSVLFLATTHAIIAGAQMSVTTQRADRIADSVLKLMTLDEKLGQLTQLPAGSDQTGPTVDVGGL
ncbi:MAG: hypothetical protein ABI664_01095, partial [bacterium]